MKKHLWVGAMLSVAATGCGAEAGGDEGEPGTVAQQIGTLGNPVMRNQWVCNAGEMMLGLDTSVLGGRVVCQPTTFAPGSSNYQTNRNANGEAVCSGEPGVADAVAVGWQPLGPDAGHPNRKVGIICRTLVNFTAGYDQKYAKDTITSADLQTPAHSTTTFYSGGQEVQVCANPSNHQYGGYGVRGYTVKSIVGVGTTGFYNCAH
jgi:hypothetical protein